MQKILFVAALVIIFAAGCSVQGEKVSDADVTSNVETALNSLPGVDRDQIDVKSNNGVVTLNGEVDSRDTKDRINDVVNVVEGVDRVENRLEVAEAAPGGIGAGPTTRTTEEGTTEQREEQMERDQVEEQREQQVERRETTQQQDQTSQDVRSALKRSNSLSGVNMNVRTQDGTVILTGTVPNQASKELAERIAREQQGVTNVKNNLQVRGQQ